MFLRASGFFTFFFFVFPKLTLVRSRYSCGERKHVHRIKGNHLRWKSSGSKVSWRLGRLDPCHLRSPGVYAVIMKFGTGFAKQTHTHISLLWGSFWISWPNSHEWDRMGSFNRLIPVRCTLGTGKLVFIPHKRLNTFKRIWLWGPHTKKVKSNLWRFWHPKIAKKCQLKTLHANISVCKHFTISVSWTSGPMFSAFRASFSPIPHT